MVRKAKYTDEEKGIPRGIYVAPKDWNPFMKTFPSKDYTSASAFFRAMIRDRNKAFYDGGELKEEFDIDSKTAIRDHLRNKENKRLKPLLVPLTQTRNVYEVLCGFAGVDLRLEKGLDKAIAKMAFYDCNGSEPFSRTNVEDFVEYLETVKKRKEIDAEIIAHRRQKLKPD